VKQQYLPDSLVGTKFYNPTDIGYEKQVAEHLRYIRQETEQGKQEEN
jgi:putative ATPase